MNKNYKMLTLKNLYDFVMNNKKSFPDGIDTIVASGDFEGNYHHIFHEMMLDKVSGQPAVFVGYEMHESEGRI